MVARTITTNDPWSTMVCSVDGIYNISNHCSKTERGLAVSDAILTGSQTIKDAVLEATISPPPIKVIPTGAYLQDYPRPPHFIDHVPHLHHEKNQSITTIQDRLAIAVAGDIDQKSDAFY